MAREGKSTVSKAPTNEVSNEADTVVLEANSSPPSDNGNLSDDEVDPDPQDTKNYNYVDGRQIFQFENLRDTIDNYYEPSAEDSVENGPPADPISRAAHNEKHRALWHSLKEKVRLDQNIPDSLWNPPRTFIQVKFAEWPRHDHYCCPCDLDRDALSTIQIRAKKGSKTGITKDIFLEEVGRALYGFSEDDIILEQSNATSGTENDRYVVGGENDRPVVDHVEYMMVAVLDDMDEDQPEGPVIMGDIYMMLQGFKENL